MSGTGSNFKEALAQTGLAMFEVMTDTRRVLDNGTPLSFTVECLCWACADAGEYDVCSMVYKFMEELLYSLSSDLFVVCSIEDTHIDSAAKYSVSAVTFVSCIVCLLSVARCSR